MSNYIIKCRPQISAWDRMRGKPFKAITTAIGKAEEHGELARSTRDNAVVQWRDNTIWSEQDANGHCIAWIYFSVNKSVLCIICIWNGYLEEVRRHWDESWREVSGGHKGKGKDKGKRKGKEE